MHNWANSFANKNTPLAKRFLNDYRKDFHFSKENERRHTIIHNITIDYQIPVFNEVINHPDILKIDLNKPLQPKDSVTITAFYTIKFPNAKFTGYGKTLNGYHFRFWYLIPAVFKKDWQLMSNLNL